MDNEQELETVPVMQPTLTEKEIEARAKLIKPQEAAAEVNKWIIDHVEEYVNNRSKLYRLYITVADCTGMPNITELQTLYLSIPGPEDSSDQAAIDTESRCMDLLDDLTTEVRNFMEADKESMTKLFDRLIYYYEMVGFSNQTGPILQEFSGYVELLQFLYEPVSLEVQIKEGHQVIDADGNVSKQEAPSKIVKTETIPEGFGIEFLLKCWPKTDQVMY